MLDFSSSTNENASINWNHLIVYFSTGQKFIENCDNNLDTAWDIENRSAMQLSKRITVQKEFILIHFD